METNTKLGIRSSISIYPFTTETSSKIDVPTERLLHTSPLSLIFFFLKCMSFSQLRYSLVILSLRKGFQQNEPWILCLMPGLR